MRWWLPVLCLGLVACRNCSRRPERDADGRADPDAERAATSILEARRVIDTGAHNGLSGLAVDDAGQPWAAPERARFLLPLPAGGDGVPARAPVPLLRVAPGTDTEALAYLGAGRFALGTETQAPGRASDDVLVVEVGDGAATVVERLTLPYALWGMRAERNRGIEGLCRVSGALVAAVETVIESDGERFAPVARYDEARRSWTAFRVRLSHEGGRLSSIACRLAEGGQRIEVLAIERDWGMARLLGFFVPLDRPGRDLPSVRLVDLAALVTGRVPNMEGLEWTAAGGLMILVDNDSGGITGPTEMLLLGPGRFDLEPLAPAVAPEPTAPAVREVDAPAEGSSASP